MSQKGLSRGDRWRTVYQALGEEGGARNRREKANDPQKAKRLAARTPVSSPLFLQHPGICLPLAAPPPAPSPHQPLHLAAKLLCVAST